MLHVCIWYGCSHCILYVVKVLESGQEEGQKKLEKALEQGNVACQGADPEDKEVIEEEVCLLQEEYDTFL